MESWSLPAFGDRPEITLQMPVASFGFQCFGVPVIYRRGGTVSQITVHHRDGPPRMLPGCRLDAETTVAVTGRDPRIERIEVEVPTERASPSKREP